jgi:hypothetical protein
MSNANLHPKYWGVGEITALIARAADSGLAQEELRDLQAMDRAARALEREGDPLVVRALLREIERRCFLAINSEVRL